MNRYALALALIVTGCMTAPPSLADAKKGKLPHVEFDPQAKQVRVECEALNVDAPLEFFCCVAGTNEHESVLRTAARPSDINIGLLAIGLKPGKPISYSESTNKWSPPQGPPLHLSIEYEKNGKTVSYPANRWLLNVKTHKSPPAFTWVYTGSRTMPDGKFAADVTGYVVSICNFDLTLIDVPELVSSANETLEWQRNADIMPKTGTKVWMVIEPVGGKDAKDAEPAKEPAPAGPKSQGPAWDSSVQLASFAMPAHRGECADAAPAKPATQPLSNVHLDVKQMDNLEKYWHEKVSPHAAALREAAEAHYKVISDLRREQQRLIDEADRIQRAIDKLEKEYQDMTTPRPEEGK
ncbi:MAG TPA: YdjY domain-containing protein [Humisphaera sp.]|nr:YdjY domain-containing protein [Humisphaera sp.]